MYPYDEAQVIAFQGDVRAAYAEAKEPYNITDDSHVVWVGRMQFDAVSQGYPVARAIHLNELRKQLGLPIPFPPAPSLDQLRNGSIQMQGLMVNTSRFGSIPWFPGAVPWFSLAELQNEIWPQLLAAGDTICLLGLPCGYPLYDEPPPNFYTADKFPALDWTSGNTGIDDVFLAYVEAALQAGFKGIWVFLDGDEGIQKDPDGHAHGYNIVIKQIPWLAAKLQGSPYGDLRPYCLVSPGWDGVFPPPGIGYSRAELQSYGETCVANGLYPIMEMTTGYFPAGDGAGSDYLPGGVMASYVAILMEAGDDQWDGSVWEILARGLPPGQYNWPGYLQPSTDDPPPHPFYLKNGAVLRVFEFGIYGFVRGTPSATIQQWRQHFLDMGVTNPC